MLAYDQMHIAHAECFKVVMSSIEELNAPAAWMCNCIMPAIGLHFCLEVVHLLSSVALNQVLMDLELKDRRGLNTAIASFSRIWPYVTIIALLILLAVTNLNRPTVQPVHSKNIVRNTLLVGPQHTQGRHSA